MAALRAEVHYVAGAPQDRLRAEGRSNDMNRKPTERLRVAPKPIVGAPVDRVDGRLKVTGGAKYAAEFPMDRIAHAVMITSTITKGHVKSIDTDALMKMPGVIAVLTPQNAPKLPGGKPNEQSGGGGVSGGAGAGGSGGGSGGGASAAQAGSRPAMRVPTLLQD